MSETPTTRSQLLRPLHLLLIALGCGIFAGLVTAFSTGAFTSRVNALIASGQYEGLTPVGLSLVVGGSAFIATLLLLSMLILAVDPAQVTNPVDRPVLLPPQDGTGTPDAASDSSSPDSPPAR